MVNFYIYYNDTRLTPLILYPLRLGPLFSNDDGILKPKVGLRPNRIEIDLRKCFWKNITLFGLIELLLFLNKDHRNPRACVRIHAYAHACSSSTCACFMHAYAYMGMCVHLETRKERFSTLKLSLEWNSHRLGAGPNPYFWLYKAWYGIFSKEDEFWW